MMRMDQVGMELLKTLEGYSDTLYNDVAGYSTIGYGHLVHKGMVGTNNNAEKYFKEPIDAGLGEALLRIDVMKAEYVVNAHVKDIPMLTQGQFNALVSFTYNVGGHAFQTSTLLKVIKDKLGHANKKEIDLLIAEQLRRWKYANKRVSQGLANRREQEIKMWRNRWIWS